MASRPLTRADVSGVPVGVMGLGVAGRAMARVLAAMGAKLVLVDENAAIAEALDKEFVGSRICVGHVPDDVFSQCAIVAKSPGVPPGHPALHTAQASGATVLGEVELIALMEPPGKTLAITGTNGKSTTTSLTGALAQGLGQHVFVGGNLGDAIGDWVGAPPLQRAPQAILELSSYQIDGRMFYQPDVAVVLNVTPDHLARYGTFEHYVRSKTQLVAALPQDGTAVLNADDAATVAMQRATRARVLWFTTQRALPQGLAGASGMVVRDGMAVPVGSVAHVLEPMPLQHPVLIGAHNWQNTLAALLGLSAFMPLSGRGSALHEAYLRYTGLPHRLAPVATVKGVHYLNDSKATNDASAATAVRAMVGPFILLVGGQDKGGGYRALLTALQQRPAKAIIAFGAARELLSTSLKGEGRSVHVVATMQDACALAQKMAVPHDTVLLSPACTSFDAFRHYQHRGDVFAAWVNGHVAP